MPASRYRVMYMTRRPRKREAWACMWLEMQERAHGKFDLVHAKFSLMSSVGKHMCEGVLRGRGEMFARSNAYCIVPHCCCCVLALQVSPALAEANWIVKRVCRGAGVNVYDTRAVAL